MTLLKHGSGNPHSLTTALLRHRRQGAPGAGFDISTMVFTPAMSKRPGPAGVFDAAPIVQGQWDGTGTPDVLSLPRGDLLGNAVGHFYANFDPYQGTILKWITPEISSADLASGYAYLWYISADYYGRYDYANNRFDYRCGGVTATRATAIVAGTSYLIAVSWDTKATIDGTNYVRDGLNDNFAYGGTTLTASAPDAVTELGSDGSASPVNAILEGVFYYRRVLYDGTYGTPPVDQTDELAAIYAAGAGLDPAQVTGSWDTTLCVPTNSTPGALVTGEGEAWSHPHSNALLDDTFCAQGGLPGTPFAVELNGTSTFIDCGSDPTLDDIPAAGGQITAGIWFRMDWTSGEAVIIAKGQVGASGYTVFLNSSGYPQFEVYLATNNVSATYTQNVRDGKWHYCALHYNDATKTGRVSVDGRWGSADVGVGAYQSDAARSLFVGRRPVAASWYLQGGAAWWEVWDNDHHTTGTDFIPPRAPTAAGPANLIETWWADEGAGATVAARVTTPANDGTITNPAPDPWTAVWQQYSTPVIPQSFLGDSSATIIDCGSGATLDDLADNAFTSEAWVYSNVSTSFLSRLHDKSQNGTVGWYTLLGTAGGGVVKCVTTDAYVEINTDTYTLHKWSHVAMTWDDAGDRKVRIFVNGVLRGISDAGVGAVIADAAVNLYGMNRNNGTRSLRGAMGWNRISDVVRYTGTTVGKAYFVPDGRSNPPAIDGNTVMQLDMNDGAGTTATDTSGNANHGTITMGTGRWLNTPDMEIESPGERSGPWGYAAGSDGVGDGLTIIENQEVVAGVSYVIRASLSIGMSGAAWPAIYAYDNIGAVNLLTHRFPRMTGPHTGANNAASLTDAGARWIYNFAGWTVYNVTDGSSATITSNSEYNIVGGLAGGTDNDWDTNDVYLLRPPDNRSYSQHPWQETVVVTAPAGCTRIDVRALNLASKGIMHVHQVEMYKSLAVNGDHESLNGGFPGAAELITGWTSGGLDAGDTEPEAVVVHAGVQSLEWNASASDENQYLGGSIATIGRFYGVGVWEYNDGSSEIAVGGWSPSRSVLHNDATTFDVIPENTARWLEAVCVIRAISAEIRLRISAETGATGDRYTDDVYCVELDDVTLTVTPASEANSLEPAPDYIRVDGDDQCALPANGLDRAGGLIFRTVVRQDITVAPTFRGEPGSLLDLQLDAGNYLYLRIMNAAAQIHLDYQAATGGAQNSIWAPGVLWEPGDTLLLRVEYGAFGVRLWADGLLVINNVNPCFFDAAPTTRLIGGGVGATSGAPDIVIGEP